MAGGGEVTKEYEIEQYERDRDWTTLLFTTVECDAAWIETTVGEWGCSVSNS